MAKRLLSTAVCVRKGPTQAAREAAILRGESANLSMPSDRDMRDALGKLVKDLEEMRQARTAGGAEWTVVEGSFAPRTIILEDGEVVLRGGILIERPD